MGPFRDLMALAKDQGAVVAGWVLLFGVVAWITGQGARGAVRNVSSLLRMNERLRASLEHQLEASRKAQHEAERSNAELQAQLSAATRRMDDLEGRLLFAERRSRTLEADLTATLAENKRLRNIIHGMPLTASIPQGGDE